MTVGLARKLSRTKSHRDALMRNLVTQLLQHGTIISTHEKCKEASRIAERVITWAKKVNENPKSPLLSEIQSRLFLSGDNSKLMTKLLVDIAPRYTGRAGGYTRVLHLESRLGDSARQSVLELVGTPVVDTQGNLNRGNLKLWLLVKNTLSDEVSNRRYNDLTLQNLRKMLLGKTKEQLAVEILAVRKFIKEAQHVEWNDVSEKEQVELLMEQVSNVETSKPKKIHGTTIGYNFVHQRPDRDTQIAKQSPKHL